MERRPIVSRGAPTPGIRCRMLRRAQPREFTPHLLRDIGLESVVEHPHIPPFAALVTRV